MTATPLAEPAAWDAFVVSNELGSYLQRTAWARVKAVNGWTSARVVAGGASPIGAQVLLRRPRPLPWAFAYAPRGPVAAAWTAASLGDVHGGAAVGLARPGLARADRSRGRARRTARRGRLAARHPGRGRLASRAADPAAVDARDRPGGRRAGPVGRPAQQVATVREQGPRQRRDRGGAGRGRRSDRALLRDLPRDGAPGGLPDPGRAGLPRRLGCISANRRRDPPVRDRPRGHAPGGALPGPQRAPGRGALRRHDQWPVPRCARTTC